MVLWRKAILLFTNRTKMDCLCLKTLLWLACLTITIELIQGAGQCYRTNSDPARHCTDECTLQTGCRQKKKQCICDGDCGYSCIDRRQKCSMPRKKIRNGRIISSSYRFNATQRTICDQGFKLSGSALRTCRGNGFWDGKKSRCKKRQKPCQDPGTTALLLRYTKASPNGFKPGTRLQYYCPPNFVFKGARIMICQTDGTWSAPLPACNQPTCRQAVLPAHSYVIRPSNWKSRKGYGVRLTLGCNPGYTTPQRAHLVCITPDWQLKPADFKCYPKTCRDPGRLRNGERKGLFIFGEKVYFKCDKCYKLNGPPYRQCQANQIWSDTQPTCELAYCSRLGNFLHGVVTVRSRAVCGGTAQYVCNRGYHLIGSPRRTCQSNGTWSGNEPTCNDNTSPTRPMTSPTRPMTSRTRSMTSAPSKSTSTTKKPTRTIMPTTRPLSTTIRVQSQCGHPTLPAEAKISAMKMINSRKALFIRCQSHYSLLSIGIMVCEKTRRWRTYRNVSCLLKGCPFLGVPLHGAKHGLSHLINDKVKFTCDKCYTLDGHAQRTCLKNGSWSHTQPKCVLITCQSVPKNISQTTVKYSTLLTCGSVAKYKCTDPTYLMLGSGEKTCSESGVWTGDEPKCVDRNENIALGKPTQQSSMLRGYPGPSSRAVDGSRNTYYSSSGSCTHTAANLNPWWRVDLGQKETVSMVIVVNRGDCCAIRLNNFEVWVSDDKDYRKGSKCGGKARPAFGEVIKVKCSGVLRGRYVIVRVPGYNFLTLCEVEVYRNVVH